MPNVYDLIHIAINLKTRYEGKKHGGWCIYEDEKIIIAYDDYFPNVEVNIKDTEGTCVYSSSGHGITSIHKPGAWEDYISTLVPRADAAKAEKESIRAAKEKREQQRRFGGVDDGALFGAKVKRLEEERDCWLKTAREQATNAEFWRGLVHGIGEQFGREAHIADDGSYQQDVLGLKIPELVAACRGQVLALQAQAEKQASILKLLAAADPVYGPVTIYGPRGPMLEEGKKLSVRICALCRAMSGDNEENVLHRANCPWIPAKRSPSSTPAQSLEAVRREAKAEALEEAANDMCGSCASGNTVAIGKAIPEGRDEVYHGVGLNSWPCTSDRLHRKAKSLRQSGREGGEA